MTFGVNLIVWLEILSFVFRGPNEPPSGFFCKSKFTYQKIVKFS